MIGLFGFGGGYGMLSLIQNEVVQNHHWMSSGEFTDIVAVSQMTPGPIGINSATYCGYTAVHHELSDTLSGISLEIVSVVGSLIATFAVVLPSLILMLLIAKLFLKYMKTKPVQDVFAGLRPAVVGLLGAAVLLLMTTENFSSPKEDLVRFIVSCLLFIGAFIGVWYKWISPIKMICLCAVIGAVLL
ncbi:MAG: chromate transporter [Prevotella sp.]|nr:chromate transporter [Prevotella sp.]